MRQISIVKGYPDGSKPTPIIKLAQTPSNFHHLAYKKTGLTLRELGEKAGGMDYSAVAVSVLRLNRKSRKNRSLRKLMKQVAEQCQK